MSTWIYVLGSRSLHTLYLKALFMCCISQIWLRGDYISSEKNCCFIFCLNNLIVTFDLETSFRIMCANHLTKGTPWVIYNPDWNNGKKHDPGRDFFKYNSATSWTSDLKLGSRSLHIPYPIALFEWSARMSQTGPREEKMLRTSDLGWTDRRMDKLIDGQTDC